MPSTRGALTARRCLPPPQSAHETRRNGELELHELYSRDHVSHHWLPAQMLFFRAAAGKAFTIFRAGFASTITTLPKTSLLPAFVAGFVRVFNLHKPGREKRPVLPTSFVAISAKLSMNFEHTDFFSSHEVASASAIAPFVIGLPAVFIVPMGAIFPH